MPNCPKCGKHLGSQSTLRQHDNEIHLGVFSPGRERQVGGYRDIIEETGPRAQEFEEEIQQLGEEIQQLGEEHEDEIQQLGEEHEDEIHRREAEHEEEIQQLGEEHEEEIQQLGEEHEEEIQQQKGEHGDKIQQLKKENKRLQMKHEDDIHRLEGRHEDEMERLKEENKRLQIENDDLKRECEYLRQSAKETKFNAPHQVDQPPKAKDASDLPVGNDSKNSFGFSAFRAAINDVKDEVDGKSD